MQFPFGFEEIRVVQRHGCLFADARKEENVIFGECRSVLFVNQLDDADDLLLLPQRRANDGLNLKFASGLNTLSEQFISSGIFDKLRVAATRRFGQVS